MTMIKPKRKMEPPGEASRQTTAATKQLQERPKPSGKKRITSYRLLRWLAGVLAAVFVLRNFFVAFTMEAHATDLTVQDLLPQALLRLSGGSDSGGHSDLTLYPPDFQELQSREPPGELEKDPSSWTDQERSKAWQAFQEHNRESLYSLLLVRKNETQTNSKFNNPLSTPWSTDTALCFGPKDMSYIHEHLRKRHKEGLYVFHDVAGKELDYNEEAKFPGRVRESFLKETAERAWKRAEENHGDLAGNGQRISKPRVIYEGSLCHAFYHARGIANFEVPHVLVTHLNENWGGLSVTIPNRTVAWGNEFSVFGEKRVDGTKFYCDPFEFLEKYLESPNTLAVFTTQHQGFFDHPKIHSIPLGVSRDGNGAKQTLENLADQRQSTFPSTTSVSNATISTRQPHRDLRPNLLMINSSPSDNRVPQMNAAIANFAKSGIQVNNTYGRLKRREYLEELGRSKFILCPSGMGFGAYRIWESLTMGAIPVLERTQYRYEIVSHQTADGRTIRKLVRGLPRGDPGKNLEASRGVRWSGHALKFLDQHNGSKLEILEYEDGWRRALDDLPVVWIDGRFDDPIPKPPEPGKVYLTPEFLKGEYDRLSARAHAFRYEKMSSLYWIRLLESYLLLEDPASAHGKIEKPMSGFANPDEARTWQSAMQSLSSTFNNHTMLEPIGKGFAGWEDPPTTMERIHRLNGTWSSPKEQPPSTIRNNESPSKKAAGVVVDAVSDSISAKEEAPTEQTMLNDKIRTYFPRIPID